MCIRTKVFYNFQRGSQVTETVKILYTVPSLPVTDPMCAPTVFRVQIYNTRLVLAWFCWQTIPHIYTPKVWYVQFFGIFY